MPKRKSKSPKKKGRKNLLPLFLLLLGVIFIVLSLSIKAFEARRLSFSQNLPSSIVNHNAVQPVKIAIPSLQIALPVGETTIKDGVWEIYAYGASHLETSANPGEENNIIIYAHNTKGRFKRLLDIKEGDLITLKSLDGKIHKYKTISTQIVKPSQIELLLPTKSETLTMYTCTGFADLKRFVVRAKPI